MKKSEQWLKLRLKIAKTTKGLLENQLNNHVCGLQGFRGSLTDICYPCMPIESKHLKEKIEVLSEKIADIERRI